MSHPTELEPFLEENDVRSMIRLMGDVAALPGDHGAKKAFLMQGVCQLIEADKWAWALVCDIAADRPPVASCCPVGSGRHSWRHHVRATHERLLFGFGDYEISEDGHVLHLLGSAVGG